MSGHSHRVVVAAAFVLTFAHLSLLPVVAQAKTYYLVSRAEIQGNDILCGKKDYNGKPYPYCEVCDGIRGASDACDDNPQCKAISMDGSYCGYLKTSTSTKYRENYNTYVTGSAPKGSYKMTSRTSIPGNDINCNQKNDKGVVLKFCKVCGGVSAVAKSCSANPNCKAFDMEDSYCGYLKSANKPVYTDKFDSYQKM
jgi:hypothetical protein